MDLGRSARTSGNKARGPGPGEVAAPGICTFCCVRIHVLKSTQARQGRLPEMSSAT